MGSAQYFHCRDMRKAAGARKPSESQNAKALWAMKAAKDREEEFYDPARKDNILRRKQTRLELWRRAHQGPNKSLGQSSEVPRESASRLIFGSRHLVKSRASFNGLWPERLRHCGKDVGMSVLGRRLALSGPVGQCAFCAQLPLIGTFR